MVVSRLPDALLTEARNVTAVAAENRARRTAGARATAELATSDARREGAGVEEIVAGATLSGEAVDAPEVETADISTDADATADTDITTDAVTTADAEITADTDITTDAVTTADAEITTEVAPDPDAPDAARDSSTNA